VFTWKSSPSGCPAASKRRACALEPAASVPALPPPSHVTTKPPAPSWPTPGNCWYDVVYVLTCDSIPTGVPAGSKRRIWMLPPLVSDPALP
jgi:hypothetical protein